MCANGAEVRDDAAHLRRGGLHAAPMSRRAFAGTLGAAAGVAFLDTPLVSRVAEAATKRPRPADAVILSSNENPYGPSAEGARGRREGRREPLPRRPRGGGARGDREAPRRRGRAGPPRLRLLGDPPDGGRGVQRAREDASSPPSPRSRPCSRTRRSSAPTASRCRSRPTSGTTSRRWPPRATPRPASSTSATRTTRRRRS